MTATSMQCSYWRTMRPRREAVLIFTLKWYIECRCWPEPCDVRYILGMPRGGDVGDLLRDVRREIAEAMK